jgi:hypothetical protein
MTLPLFAPIPCTSSNLAKLRSLLVEIYTEWLSLGYSSGDLFAQGKIRKKMQQAISLVPIKDAADGLTFNIDAIADDYDALESLFLAQKKNISTYGSVSSGTISDINFVESHPSILVELHLWSFPRILAEADKARRSDKLINDLGLEGANRVREKLGLEPINGDDLP